MRSKLRLVLIAGVSIVSVLLASCANVVTPPMNASVKDYDVFLKVSGNPKELTFEERGNSKCDNIPSQPKGKFGCVTVVAGNQGSIVFKLTPSSWHVTKMTICHGDEKDNDNCVLSAEQQQEFAVTKAGSETLTLTLIHPGANGVIDLSRLPRLNTFTLVDTNYFKADYFYTITACNLSNTECLDTDPVISNGGNLN